MPIRGEARLAEKQRVVTLKQQLQAAINEEDFEKAAKLRDEIKKLEQEGGQNA